MTAPKFNLYDEDNFQSYRLLQDVYIRRMVVQQFNRFLLLLKMFKYMTSLPKLRRQRRSSVVGVS